MKFDDTALGTHTGLCCADTINRFAWSASDCDLAHGATIACGGHFLRLVDSLGLSVWRRMRVESEPERVIPPPAPAAPVRFIGVRRFDR